MKTRYRRRINLKFIRISILAAIVAAFFLPSFVKYESQGDNFFTVFINNQMVGTVGDKDELDSYVRQIRTKIASESQDLCFMNADITTEGKEVLWGKIDDTSVLKANIERVLRGSTKATMTRAYTVKVNEYAVNLASYDEVLQVLQAAIDRFDTEGEFTVELSKETDREFDVLTSRIVRREEEEQEESLPVYDVDYHGMRDGGVAETIDTIFEQAQPAREKNWNEYEYGILSMGFAEEVEVVESYLPENQLTSVQTAIEEMTKDQEKNTVYTVVPGDTLIGISNKTDIPVDRLIELNDTLDNEYSTLHIDDELIITVPEPEISVERTEQSYIEEYYDADIIYVPNDDWYTTQTKTLQEPSSGFRKIVAAVTYRNSTEIAKEVIKEEVVMEAVPKIVERGTKIPPTYIKPISGGSISSYFGYRKSPTKGASSYHKGVDWYTPIGTPVYASSAGTVTKAGWGSGYGYCVYISHADGRETVYGHLSKVLVSAGTYVEQGQRIASSGNTGISTGPHLHFEIHINGQAVNPLDYLN